METTIKTGYEIKYIKKGGKRVSRNPIYGFHYKDLNKNTISYLSSIHSDNSDIYIESIEDLKFKLTQNGITIIDITEFEYYIYDERTFSSMDDVNYYISKEEVIEVEAEPIATMIKYNNTEETYNIYNKSIGWVEYKVNNKEDAIDMFNVEYGDLLIERIVYDEGGVTVQSIGYLYEENMVEETVVDPEMVELNNVNDMQVFDNVYFIKSEFYIFDIKINNTGEYKYLFMNKFNDKTDFIGMKDMNIIKSDYTVINSNHEYRFCVVNREQYNTFLNIIKGDYDMLDINAYNNLYEMLYNQYEYLNENDEFGCNVNDKIKCLEERLIKFDNGADLYIQVEYDVINNWLYNFRMELHDSSFEYINMNSCSGDYGENDCIDLNELIFN